uniref:AlNc14C15G1688 protein n=1 Tax=Albugo laibachii Nc14 TaxID=890382 RepID=F0W3Y9_9STRA|nr:AlNc14C15G1688 [Albugo laibachii Nc14]|eukprot:CCA15784.1 AlNc14C15G1688 [Albugo laibachii Nc14]
MIEEIQIDIIPSMEVERNHNPLHHIIHLYVLLVPPLCTSLHSKLLFHLFDKFLRTTLMPKMHLREIREANIGHL